MKVGIKKKNNKRTGDFGEKNRFVKDPKRTLETKIGTLKF